MTQTSAYTEDVEEILGRSVCASKLSLLLSAIFMDSLVLTWAKRYIFFLNEGLAVKNLIWGETGFGQHGSMRCLRAGVFRCFRSNKFEHFY